VDRPNVMRPRTVCCGNGASSRTRTRTDARTDSGSTLIEIVVAVAIMAIIAVPFGSALWMTVRASARSMDDATAQTVLSSAADRINRASPACDYAVFAKAAATAAGWPASTITTNTRRYTPNANPQLAGTWDSGGCAPSQGPSAVQLVTVTLAARPGSSGGTVTIEVVKSAL